MKPEKWTPTLIKAAKGCIRRFQLLVDKEPPEVEVEAFKDGIIAHEKIEGFLKSKNPEFLKGFPEAVVRDAKVISSYDGNIYIEKELEGELVKGTADIVVEKDKSWIVIDIKSRYISDIEEDDLLQLYTYLYLLQLQKEKENAMIGIFALWNAYNPLKLSIVENPSLEFLEKYITHAIESAERSLKKGRINFSSCHYCEYILSCEYSKTKDLPKKITEIAKLYIHTKGLLAACEAALRSYISDKGQNITIDNLEIGFHPKNVALVDMEQLKKCIFEKNLDLDTIFKPNITALKSLARKDDDIANCITIEPQYYFGVRTIKDKGGEDNA